MHKILEECSALVRKSIEGLDNFIMEGCRGFTDLEAVLDLIDIQEEFRLLKEGLVEGKRYLKSELKVCKKKKLSHIVKNSFNKGYIYRSMGTWIVAIECN